MKLRVIRDIEATKPWIPQALSRLLAQALRPDRSCQSIVNDAAIQRLQGGLPPSQRVSHVDGLQHVKELDGDHRFVLPFQKQRPGLRDWISLCQWP